MMPMDGIVRSRRVPQPDLLDIRAEVIQRSIRGPTPGVNQDAGARRPPDTAR